MSRFIEVLTGDERDRDESETRLPANDPLALFHQLKQDSAPAAASELASMKAAVAELRRARELSRRSDEITGDLFLPRFAAEAPRLADRAPRFANRAPARLWRMPAAAAALFAALVFFGGSGSEAPRTVADSGASSAAVPAAVPALAEGRASFLPLVEDLDPRQAEMIQIEDEGMSLVVVLAAGSV